jgi:hypothetical protein
MWRKNRLSLTMTLLLAAATGCTAGPHGPLSGWVRHRATLTAGQMATALHEVSGLAPEAVPAEIQRLEVATAKGRAADRLKLACLLGRTDSGTPDPDRALTLLEGLASAFQDQATQEIAHLLARTFALERDLRLARHQTAELQQKIEQLKGLERELDDSDGTIEPLSTPPARLAPQPREPVARPPATTPGGPSP